MPSGTNKNKKPAVKTSNTKKTTAQNTVKKQKQGKTKQQNNRLGREFKELVEEVKKAGLSLPKEAWFKVGYGVFVVYIAALLYRYYYAINWLQPTVISNDIVIILMCAAAPFVLWMFSTNYERWRFHNRKKFWIYTVVYAGVATLEQPLMPILHRYLVSKVMLIPVTENMTEGMVVLLGRLCLIIPYILLNCIVLVPVHKALTSTEINEKIEDYIVTETFDTRKNKGHLYDLNIIKDLKTGRHVPIYQGDRFVHMFINGQTGTGKTSSTIIPAVAEDLNTKIKNMEAREKALLQLLYDKKAYIAGPFNKVTEHNIRPRKGYEKEYKEIYDKYPDCGIIVMAPNNDMNDTIVALCEARGIQVNVIDPAKKYTEKCAVAKGIANFYIPDNLSEEEVAIRIIEQAETFSEVIVATNERSGEGEQYFRDINTAITTNIAIICMLSARILGRETDINEVNVCVHNFKKLEDKVKIIEDYYGFRIDVGTVEKSRNGVTTEDLKNRLKKKESLVETSDERNPFYTIIIDAKKDLLGPGAEKMEDQTRGLRNILDKILRDQRFNRILSTPRGNSVDFDEILSKNQVTVINTALEYGAPKSSALGIMTLLNLTNAMLRRPKEKRSPQFIWVDEASQYMHKIIEDMYALFRQYGGSVCLAMQSTSQMDKFKTTAYLKGVILGAGTQILFGRVSAEEMKLYEALAGEKIEDSIQKSISQTSLLTSTASQNESERMVKEKKNVITGRDIRRRNFQEVTVFKIENNRVKDGFLGKCSFLDKKELKPKSIQRVNFAALVPAGKVKKEVKLTKPAKKTVKKQKDFIQDKKENIQILTLDQKQQRTATKIEDTIDVDITLKETVKEKEKRRNLENKKAVLDAEIQKSDKILKAKKNISEEEKTSILEGKNKILDEKRQIEETLDNLEVEESLFGNLFEEEEEEYVNTSALEEEMQKLMERNQGEEAE